MYKLVALSHSVFARIKTLGACELREEYPSHIVVVSVRPNTSRADTQQIRSALHQALPGRRIMVSIRAVEPPAESPALCQMTFPAFA